MNNNFIYLKTLEKYIPAVRSLISRNSGNIFICDGVDSMKIGFSNFISKFLLCKYKNKDFNYCGLCSNCKNPSLSILLLTTKNRFVFSSNEISNFDFKVVVSPGINIGISLFKYLKHYEIRIYYCLEDCGSSFLKKLYCFINKPYSKGFNIFISFSKHIINYRFLNKFLIIRLCPYLIPYTSYYCYFCSCTVRYCFHKPFYNNSSICLSFSNTINKLKKGINVKYTEFVFIKNNYVLFINYLNLLLTKHKKNSFNTINLLKSFDILSKGYKDFIYYFSFFFRSYGFLFARKI